MTNDDSENSKVILNIPELKNVTLTRVEFIKDKANQSKKKVYQQSVTTFLNWYVSYCNTNLKTKKYSDDKIAEIIFCADFKNQSHFNEYLIKSLCISREYVEYLIPKITQKNIQVYEHTILSLQTDLEWLIANYEVNVKKSTQKISLNSGRRKNLSPTDIFSALRTVFFIEEIEKIEDLYLRDLKPIAMFQIRQLIEIFGRNIIGYYAITKNDLPVKKFTQIAWDFIQEENNKNNSRITFPFNVDTIIAINAWSNDFVHTTFLHNSYIQYFALKAINVLFYSKSSGIKIYTNATTQKFDISDIKIEQYNSLKIDFENYLISRMPEIKVEWMDPKNVGAYIISL